MALVRLVVAPDRRRQAVVGLRERPLLGLEEVERFAGSRGGSEIDELREQNLPALAGILALDGAEEKEAVAHQRAADRCAVLVLCFERSDILDWVLRAHLLVAEQVERVAVELIPAGLGDRV